MVARPASPSPRVLGLTGPIACGKTTVGTILLELGALARIDADAVVHRLYLPGTAVTTAIARAFGPSVLNPRGEVDRHALADVVFADPAARRRLETIVHPAVRVAIRRELSQFAGREGVVVVDAVRLLQSDLLSLCHGVWVVLCDPAEQERRLHVERGMSPEEITRRQTAMPLFDHPAVTSTIVNDGSLADLRQSVQVAWETFLSP